MEGSLFSRVIFKIGPIQITEVILTSWAVIAVLCLFSVLITRRLSLWQPGKLQVVVESIVEAIAETIEKTLNANPWPFVPLVGGLWIYIGFMNLVNLLPGLHNPTRDLATTTALAFVSFMSVHYYGIKHHGLSGYLKHYLEPVFILAPFNLFGELSRSAAMAVRLFGNMLSWEMIVAILLVLAGFLVPVPIIILSLVGDLIQAYLFGALTLVFIAGSIQTIEHKGFVITETEQTGE
ncbi:MAG: F0F1 ATP synthase subunit A [Nitrospirae bacterium]|nr:MAG: F0F1 ATP synthase subunit A [Nitrospirota bacterium]